MTSAIASASAGGLLDPTGLLTGWGPSALVGVAAMVFIESGLLFPFLPGDSLLFTAGLLRDLLGYSLPTLIVVVSIAAIVGDQVGYYIGHRFGRGLFKPDARVLKTEYLERAEDFYRRYGGRAIVLARFVPFVRTFVPVVAGMTRYGYRHFIGWNILGGIGWAVLLCTAGATLGGVPFIAGHVDLIAIGIVVVSLVPIAISAVNGMRSSKPGQATTSPRVSEPVN